MGKDMRQVQFISGQKSDNNVAHTENYFDTRLSAGFNHRHTLCHFIFGEIFNVKVFTIFGTLTNNCKRRGNLVAGHFKIRTALGLSPWLLGWIGTTILKVVMLRRILKVVMLRREQGVKVEPGWIGCFQMDCCGSR